MEVAAFEQADRRLAHCKLSEAAMLLASIREDGDERRRLLAAAYALAGDDPRLAGIAAPELLASRDLASVRAYLASLGDRARSHDYLVAGAVSAWLMDAAGTYDLLRESYDRAFAEKRFHIAAGARDSLARQAILFGDVEIARTAVTEAMRVANAHRCTDWFVRASGAAARLALDAADPERAAQIVGRAVAYAKDADGAALLAPAGASLAVASGDGVALQKWTSAEIVAAALRAETPEVAIAATIALLAAGESERDPAAPTAMRRALLQSLGSSHAVELFSLTARFGDLDESRLAADALGALIAPNRKYVKAHALLARAHLLFRCGERAAWIDHAGDAARAFNAMGMRRWMNEAMLLLVRQENDNNFPRRRRGRPEGSALTGREQQVAHLIRRGARNREVAAALQISEHTVERHVSSILGRLGLRSRWQIVDPQNVSEP